MSDPLRDRVVAAIGDLYDVEREVGRGAMSVVYAARDVRLGRRVALKVLPPELAFRGDVRARFLREAETAARLTHPNVVPIYAVDERDGVSYIAMALVEGESLGARLVREPRPPIAVVRRILVDVADALAYAHARGVVHRDIKPDNILLDRESGRPLVTDFGIARAAEGDARLTVTGVAVGTPAYMSPEQALGEREVDGRSDVYSLGIVGYQMLAGAPPFAATNTPAILMKHLSEPVRPLRELRPDVPPDLAAAVERALEKRVDARWPDAAALRDAVRAEGAGARPMEPLAPLARVPAAQNGSRGEVPAREAAAVLPPPPGVAPLPPVPGTTPAVRADWKAARRAYQPPAPPPPANPQWGAARPRGEVAAGDPAVKPVERRIRDFRRSLGGYGAVVAGLGAVNALTTPWFPWFLFPAVGMGIPILIQLGSLWADRVRLGQIFGHEAVVDSADLVNKLVTPEVLGGPYGTVVRGAVADQRAITETLARLQASDKSLLPDVTPTVQGLVERVAALAAALTRLDADVTPEMLETIDGRLVAARREPAGGGEQERRLALLERQRATIADLLGRRAGLAGQLESAALMIENIKLDLMKLRSAGVGAALGDVTHATQEARALSRDIGYVLDAAAEVRKL